LSRVAGGVVCEGPCGGGTLLDVGQAVVCGWIGVSVDRAVGRLAQPVAVGVVAPEARAIVGDVGGCACKVALIGVAERLVVGRGDDVPDVIEIGVVPAPVRQVEDFGRIDFYNKE
jgi:hypothetical protein